MSVNIGSSVERIGKDAFLGCNTICEINVSDDNTNYSSENGIVFNKDEFCLKFDKTNLHEDCYMGNGKSILKHLEELRESIYNLSINVLSYREFLTDEHFQFISKVLKSSKSIFSKR